MDINEMVQKKIEEDKYKKIQQELEEEIQEFNKKTKEQLEKDLMFSYFETDFMNSDVFINRIREIKSTALKKLRWCDGFSYENFENIAESELSGSTEKALRRMYAEKALNELMDEDEVFQIGKDKYIIKGLFKKVYSTMMVFNELDETTKSEILGKILADAI